MLKRINWKGIFIGFAWLLSLSGLVLLMSFIEHKKADQQCTRIRVFIPGEQTFVNRREVDRILFSVGGELKGKYLQDINMQQLEDALKMNPYIQKAKVYADMNGVIWVRVVQREPVLRIINHRNQDFYVDADGMKIPVSPNFTARVLVANGNITEDLVSRVNGLKTPLAKDLFKTALFLQADTLWANQIEQIYVNANQEIQLVPRVGDHQIILGDAENLEEKMNKLLIFYKRAMPKIGWETYKTINLKYANQVICKRSGIMPDTLSRSIPADTLQIDTANNIRSTQHN